MISRCTRPSQINWPDYGGRGISVCERWRGPGGFENFLADMGEPGEGLTLDRIDNDGNYEPENCRWASWETQHRHSRRTRNLTFQGETRCLLDWSRKLGINQNTLTKRLNSGWSIERAFTTPINLNCRRN